MIVCQGYLVRAEDLAAIAAAAFRGRKLTMKEIRRAQREATKSKRDERQPASNTRPKKLTPADYRYIRSQCVLRGSSFAAWCAERGLSLGFASQVARGLKGGPAAERIVRELREEFGV